MFTKSFLALVLCLTTAHRATSFSPSSSSSSKLTSSTTKLQFGIPTFGGGKNNDDNEKKGGGEDKNNKNKNKPESNIGMSGLMQLITAGMGSPFLGDFEGVDEETGKFMFSLEANNLVDEVR